jgi:hypothetical protein
MQQHYRLAACTAPSGLVLLLENDVLQYEQHST